MHELAICEWLLEWLMSAHFVKFHAIATVVGHLFSFTCFTKTVIYCVFTMLYCILSYIFFCTASLYNMCRTLSCMHSFEHLAEKQMRGAVFLEGLVSADLLCSVFNAGKLTEPRSPPPRG